jgi:hypothetical protein
MMTITVNVILKPENSNNLNDLVLQISGETFASIAEQTKSFMKDYNKMQKARKPPEPLLIDWIVADKDEISGIPHAIDYGLESLVRDESDDDED